MLRGNLGAIRGRDSKGAAPLVIESARRRRLALQKPHVMEVGPHLAVEVIRAFLPSCERRGNVGIQHTGLKTGEGACAVSDGVKRTVR